MVLGDSCFFKGFGDSVGGTDSHDFGGDSGKSERAVLGKDGQSILFSCRSSCKKHHSSSISDLTRVSGSSSSSFLEGGLQFGQRFQGGAGSDSFVFVNEDGFNISVFVFDFGVHGDDFSIKKPIFLSGSGPRMRLNRQSILLQSSNSEFFRDIFRSGPHSQQTISRRFMFKHGLTDQAGVQHILHIKQSHIFDSSSDSNINHISLDFIGNLGHRF